MEVRTHTGPNVERIVNLSLQVVRNPAPHVATSFECPNMQTFAKSFNFQCNSFLGEHCSNIIG